MANDDRIESLRDLLPALRQLHSAQNTPDLFKVWLEDLLEAKTQKH